MDYFCLKEKLEFVQRYPLDVLVEGDSRNKTERQSH